MLVDTDQLRTPPDAMRYTSSTGTLFSDITHFSQEALKKYVNLGLTGGTDPFLPEAFWRRTFSLRGDGTHGVSPGDYFGRIYAGINAAQGGVEGVIYKKEDGGFFIRDGARNGVPMPDQPIDPQYRGRLRNILGEILWESYQVMKDPSERQILLARGAIEAVEIIWIHRGEENQTMMNIEEAGLAVKASRLSANRNYHPRGSVLFNV